MSSIVVGLLAVGVGSRAGSDPVLDPDAAATQSVAGGMSEAGGPRSLGNNCGDIYDLGIIAGGDTFVGYCVTGLENSFGKDPSCPAPCGWYTDDADGILTFQVSVSGVYDIVTCDDADDNSLELRSHGACPGDNCVAADDDSCGGSCAFPYQAAVQGVELQAATSYYLII